jgi:putative peptidoglycan lipid II flippase
MPAPRKGRAAALMVSLAVMGSRVLGVIREAVLGGMFGAGRELDAFIAAFQIPNLLRDLFAEGALSTAFTTIFAKTEEREGEATAWDLARLVLSLLLVFMGFLCVLGIVFSPFLVNLTSYGFHSVPGKFEQTVLLTRILFPFILFISLAAVVMGMLNARFVFSVPAVAPMAFNLVSVIAGVGLAAWLEPQADWHHPHFTSRGLVGVAGGVLLGGLAQLSVQLPALWRQGFRFRWCFEWRDPRLLAVWRLMWPALIAASAVEVNILVNGQFASGIDGARSWLTLAFRVLYFPVGMFGVAIATVLLPSVARYASNHDRVSFGRQVEEALRLSLFMTLPAAAGLFALAPDILAPIYQRGAFTEQATLQTAAALRAYSFGLAGYAGIKVLVPCFQALSKPRIPLRVNLIAIGLNLGLNALLVLVCKMGHVGIAASMAGVSILNCTQLLILLRREVPLGPATRWLRMGAVVLPAALLCGAGAWETARLLKSVWPNDHLLAKLIQVLLATSAGAGLYGAFTALFGLSETRMALTLVRNKLLRKT